MKINFFWKYLLISKKIKQNYRTMVKKQKESLVRDAVKSFLFSILIVIILFISNLAIFDFSPLPILGSLVGLYGALLGFIITSITILLLFDYKKSEILMKIKEAGLYFQIYDRYLKTAIILAISLAYILVIYFIQIATISLPLIFLQMINFLLIYFLIFSFIRIYKSLRLLYLIFKNLD